MNTASCDADTTHPWATRWRIPRVSTPYPRWQYEVALCVPSTPEAERYLWAFVEPTEREAEIVGSYIGYRRAYYRESWAAKMLERPFDIDDSTNTVILALTADGWKYRRMTFIYGLWPLHGMTDEQARFPADAAGLVALLDHINHPGNTEWAAWKAKHANVFDVTEQVEAR